MSLPVGSASVVSAWGGSVMLQRKLWYLLKRFSNANMSIFFNPEEISKIAWWAISPYLPIFEPKSAKSQILRQIRRFWRKIHVFALFEWSKPHKSNSKAWLERHEFVVSFAQKMVLTWGNVSCVHKAQDWTFFTKSRDYSVIYLQFRTALSGLIGTLKRDRWWVPTNATNPSKHRSRTIKSPGS